VVREEAEMIRETASSSRGRGAQVLSSLGLLALCAVAGFLFVRYAAESESPAAPVTSHPDAATTQEGSVESIAFGAHSLAQAVYLSPHVVVARVVGDPVQRDIDIASDTHVQEDVTLSVESYLKGTGEALITFTQPVEDIITHFDGTVSTYPRGGRVEMTDGTRFVLFLRQGTPGHWIRFGKPAGFEIDGETLLPVGAGDVVRPADWNLSTIGDLLEETEKITGSPPSAPR
jgi:hypothetical protein